MSEMTYLANEKVKLHVIFAVRSLEPLLQAYTQSPPLILYLIGLEDVLGDSSHSARVAGGQRESLYTWSRIADLP